VKIGPTSVSVDLRKNWEKKCRWTFEEFGCIFRVYGGKTPWTDRAQKFFGRRYPRRNLVFQIWWRSV